MIFMKEWLLANPSFGVQGCTALTIFLLFLGIRAWRHAPALSVGAFVLSIPFMLGAGAWLVVLGQSQYQ